jgi:hypothetical protein
MLTDLSRFVACENLPALEDTLWEWIHLCERDTRLEGWKDASWWYNETTSVGMFAGAVWRSGGTALSDFTTKRFDVESEQRTSTDKSRHGRCDLYFRTGQKEYYAEAKQVWSPFGLKADFRQSDIENSFEKAFSQLNRLDEGTKQEKIADTHKIALVFVVPYISKLYEDRINTQLETWTHKVQDIKHDALAWTFPPKTRTMEEEDRKILCPGVALLIRKYQ